MIENYRKDLKSIWAVFSQDSSANESLVSTVLMSLVWE